MLMSHRIFVSRYPAGTKMERPRFLLKTVIVLNFLIGLTEAPNRAVSVTDSVHWRLKKFLDMDPFYSITFMWITQDQAKEQADEHCAAVFNAGWMQLHQRSREVCAGAENPRCVDVTEGRVVHASQQKWSCQVDLPAPFCQRILCGSKTITVDLRYCVRELNLVRSGPTETTPLLG